MRAALDDLLQLGLDLVGAVRDPAMLFVLIVGALLLVIPAAAALWPFR
jgi:hypothetical protein